MQNLRSSAPFISTVEKLKVNGSNVNSLKGYDSEPGYSLTREQLREKGVYLCTLSKNGRITDHRCTYAVINGQLRIHRAAAWEDVPTTDLTVGAFLPHSEFSPVFPLRMPCFFDTGKTIQE
jgi:hypothetical protein